MPDQTSHDQLTALFAELRADAISGITPPGVAAARRTVRRRRSAGSAGAAGLAVLAMAGLAFAVGRPAPAGRDTAAPQQAAPATTRSSVLPAHGADLQALAARADAALDKVGEPSNGDLRRNAATDRDSFPLSARTGTDRELAATGTISTPVRPVQAGRYLVDVACAGRGTVGVTAIAFLTDEVSKIDRNRGPEEVVGHAGVIVGNAWSPCAEDPHASGLWIELTSAGYLRLDLVTADAAAEQAAIAYRITPIVPDTAESTRNAATALHAVRVVSDDALLSERYAMTGLRYHATTLQDLPAGDAAVAVACVGTGSITVTLTSSASDGSRPNAATQNRAVSCRPDAKVERLALTLPVTSDVQVQVRWDGAASNSAGVAYAVAN